MRSAACLVLLSAISLWGCSSDHDAIEKRLSDLGKDIQRLQTSNDALSDRLEGLETRVASVPSTRPASGEKRQERPPLRVVKLVPGSQEEAADSGDGSSPDVAPDERPDAPGQRPVIRLRGGGKEGSGKEGRSSDGSDTLARQAPEENR